MGGGKSKATPSASSTYNVDSEKVLDHYTLGQTLGRGAFGVVKVAQLRPEAVKALLELDTSSAQPHVRRRAKFAERPVAVKVMRQEKGGAEGDSSERLEAQIGKLEQQIEDLQVSMVGGGMSQLEELQWLNEYAEGLKSKLAEKRQNQTKTTPRDMMLRETRLLEKCDHRYIMQLIETFEDTTLFCVLFERCYGSVVSRFPAGVLNTGMVARQCYQLSSAVCYLHARFILHRDIKPENLMLRTPDEHAEVLLGDFGMAVELRKIDDRCQGCAGTPHFVPPEGFHSYYQSFPSDVWACGCTVYWMLLGQCPFEVTDEDVGSPKTAKSSIKSTALFNALRSTRMGQLLRGWKPQFEHDQTAALARKVCHPNQEPDFVFEGGKPFTHEGAIDLLRQMLNKMPQDRMKIDNVIRHPWVAAAMPEDEWANEVRSRAPSGSKGVASGAVAFQQVLPSQVLD